MLLKGVGASAPPAHENGEADSLEELGNKADTDGLNGLLLDEEGGDELHICCQQRGPAEECDIARRER